MSLLSRLERKFSRHAVPGVILYVIAAQVALYVFGMVAAAQQLGNRNIHDTVALVPDLVLAGEAWRLVTFLVDPPYSGPLWAFFYWYLLYFFANTLEAHWGSFRLNLYLMVGWAATVLVAMLVPALRSAPITNTYLYSSLFLAFAMLYPDFELYIFFILPVKVKWLALLMWLGIGYSVFVGGWPMFWIAAATGADFLLFLGGVIWQRGRHWLRGRRFQHAVRKGQTARSQLYHECRVCGLTSEQAPRTQFRYCSRCEGDCCYCPEHVDTHEHVTSTPHEKSSLRA
jgi:hypothetical protein